MISIPTSAESHPFRCEVTPRIRSCAFVHPHPRVAWVCSHSLVICIDVSFSKDTSAPTVAHKPEPESPAALRVRTGFLEPCCDSPVRGENKTTKKKEAQVCGTTSDELTRANDVSQPHESGFPADNSRPTLRAT